MNDGHIVVHVIGQLIPGLDGYVKGGNNNICLGNNEKIQIDKGNV